MKKAGKCEVCGNPIKKGQETGVLGKYRIHKKCNPVKKICSICQYPITSHDLHIYGGFGKKINPKTKTIKFQHPICINSSEPTVTRTVTNLDGLKEVGNFLRQNPSEDAYSFYFSDIFWGTAGSKNIIEGILADLWNLIPVLGKIQAYGNVIKEGITQIHKGKGEPYRIILYYLDSMPFVNLIPANTIMVIINRNEKK